mgnify:CR=1 FL=1
MSLDIPGVTVLEAAAPEPENPRTMSEIAFKSEFLKVLKTRGYIHQITHPAELDAAAASGVVTAYIGFDATAASLHVGSLIQIMMLRRLQQAGHRPIVLMGGGTTKIGDPTDKDQSRPLLSEAQIQANIASIKTVFAKFLTFGDGPTDAIMVDNDEWLSKFGYVEFLRDYGVHFTVNRMLAFDSVKQRLEREQPMTFLEFNYMLMQSVDFLELERRHGCLLQMGGSALRPPPKDRASSQMMSLEGARYQKPFISKPERDNDFRLWFADYVTAGTCADAELLTAALGVVAADRHGGADPRRLAAPRLRHGGPERRRCTTLRAGRLSTTLGSAEPVSEHQCPARRC